jgi:hypothetical protein
VIAWLDPGAPVDQLAVSNFTMDSDDTSPAAPTRNQQERVPSRQAASARSSNRKAEPTAGAVHVTIGQVVVRASMPPPASSPAEASRAVEPASRNGRDRLSLHDYLRGEREART